MRILCLGMVKNEADIIEAFVRHTAGLVDHVCLLDNGSSDQTREILAGLIGEGLPLTVFDDPVRGYFQAEKMTFLYRRLLPQFRPDFVLLLDADEFLAVPDRAALEAALASIPAGRYGIARWRNYVPRPEDGPAEADPPRQLRFCVDRARDRGKSKAIIRCDQADPEALWIRQGNHAITAPDLRAHRLDALELAHYPVRSVEQLKQKLVFGYLAYAERDRIAGREAYGGHWTARGKRVMDGAEIGQAELVGMALRYAEVDPATPLSEALVEAPLPATYRLRRGKPPKVSALATLAQAYMAETAAEPDRFVAALDGLRAKAAGEAAKAGAKSNETAFDADWHASKLYVDLPPFRHMLDRVKPASVLDLGCGLGAYILDFSLAGVGTTLGVDGFDPGAKFLKPGHFRQADLSKPVDLGQVFDLVTSVEVIEHIPPAHSDAFIGNIVRHAGHTILFSGAAPGQPGVRHINCQTVGHWIGKFAAHGWHPVLADTLAVRMAASFPWFRHNLVVFRKADAADPQAVDFLDRLATAPPRWNARPAVITTPMAAFDARRLRPPAERPPAPAGAPAAE
uniref:glycosyltransferase family 2 protein n=1 Tax=Falsiroseomonas oryzae TaxID=2766473 RepID=UPI0022EB16A9